MGADGTRRSDALPGPFLLPNVRWLALSTHVCAFSLSIPL